MSRKTTIIQYNCGNSNGRASRALFDSFEAPLILAIQEPLYNRHTKLTYCPAKYQLAYDAKPETRVCFMVRRDAGEEHWRRTQYSPNVAALSIQIGSEGVTVINVYNPRTRGPRIQEWPAISKALQESSGEVILLGDFNQDHAQWGGLGVACDQSADHLLTETGRMNLRLATPRGEVT